MQHDYDGQNSQTPQQSGKQKVALVHDFLLYPGGAEVVLQTLAEMYPDAPIYTLLYDKKRMGDFLPGRDIRTSFLQKWPRWIRKRHRWLLPFYGSAIEAMDLRDFDLVISSSGAWSKGLVTRLNTRHIAYIHSPMRYIWDENERYMRRIVGRNSFVLRQIFSYLRVWDYQAAQRPDRLIANSHYTQQRIAKYYRKDAPVVYPPAYKKSLQQTTDSTTPNTQKPFVVIARLSPYKNVALAMDVCAKLRLPLTIVGTGDEYKKLAKRTSEHIVLRGWVSEEEKNTILANARALLFPCEDDFGIVCVEALAAGIPVIALGRGGAKEIITDGVHGVLFADPTTEVMADGMRRFLAQEESFDPATLRMRAQDFSKERFERQMRTVISHI